MNKILVIVSLTAFLCYGVQSSALSESELEDQIINSEISVFIDFLDKLKNVTEKIIRDDQFKKSRIVVQGHLKDLRRIAKQFNDIDRAKDESPRENRLMLTFSAAVTCKAMIREITGSLFLPFVNIYNGTFTTDTMADIWREVESEYLQGAPPIYRKPMDFLAYLLAKAVVKSGLLNALKGGVEIALEIGKIDLNQLHEEVQLVLNQVGEKAAEISNLERQKEKNDFLVSLRTASGVIVFYWDQLLQHTESLSFHRTYLDSVRRWEELTELKNASETYHVLNNPVTRAEFLKWTDQTFGKYFEALARKYYTHGNDIFGDDRFNQSNWAILKIATVYGLPVYEKLTESGFGISELNRFLHRTEKAVLALEEYERQTNIEYFIRFVQYLITALVEDEKENVTDDEILMKLPMKVVKRVVLEVWDTFPGNFRDILFNDPKYQRSERLGLSTLYRDWNHVRTIFINELLKSGEFTEEQLKETQTIFINATRGILERIMKYADMAEGFDERIDKSVFTIQILMHLLNMFFHHFWETMVE